MRKTTKSPGEKNVKGIKRAIYLLKDAGNPAGWLLKNAHTLFGLTN